MHRVLSGAPASPSPGGEKTDNLPFIRHEPRDRQPGSLVIECIVDQELRQIRLSAPERLSVNISVEG